MAIDFSDDVRERELRLLVARAQYERHVANQTAALVEREFGRVLDVLLSSRFRELTQFQRQRTAQLFRELDRVIRAGYGDITKFVEREMEAYSQLEADVSRASVNAVLSPPPSAPLVTTAQPPPSITVSFYRLPKTYLQSIAKLPVQGLNIGEWFDAQAAKMTVETKRVIQQGLVEGKHSTEIARRILAPAKAAAKAGEAAPVSRRAVNEAKIVARTTVSAVQSDATTKSNAALPRSVSDSYLLVAVLDKRTSAVCRAKDGLVYKYDDPNAEHPPFHLGGCRTTERALLKGAALTLQAQKTPPTMRGYSDWLTKQPTTVQNEILGPTRAQWFRDKKMTLAEAIDSDNRILTLPQLRTKLGLDAVEYAT